MLRPSPGASCMPLTALQVATAVREIWALARKDLLIEARSKVVATQVVPFAMVILILFGLALDADSRTLRDLAPGLFWGTCRTAASPKNHSKYCPRNLNALNLTGIPGPNKH